MSHEPCCEVCGCTDSDACQVHGVPCIWVRGFEREDLCSACAPVELLTADPRGRIWLRQVMASAAQEQSVPYEPCGSLSLESHEEMDR